jgi:predicted dinucleotide-binding enzyme
MKTAIIGLGNIGYRIAANLTKGGEHVIVSERNLEKAKQSAAKLGGNAEVLPIEEAAQKADVIILAIMFDAIKEFVQTHHAALAGKIVVDPSNPVAPDGKGGFIKTLPADQSSGQIIARLLPEGAELVKAFGTTAAASLESGANRKPERAVLFYATDYPEAGRAIARLISASGFAPVSVGGIDQSIRIEAFGDLHEYGNLGKLVSEKEAEAAVSSRG